MKNRNTRRRLFWLALLLIATIWIVAYRNQTAPFQTESGMIFGTFYNITYQKHNSLKKEIEAELRRVDASLSTFNDTSTISRLNRNEEYILDTLFNHVFNNSMYISEETRGAFDITVAPLVNAWGFGFKQGRFPDSQMVDSLREFVGYRNAGITPEGIVVKFDPRVMFDCSAIAKGYAVDLIAGLLKKHKVKNFMVDIGGEVVVHGHNPQQGLWKIGINKPVDDSLAVNQELQAIMHVTDMAIATSGNYRNFYYRNGRKYAHTIDPRTGYPVEHGLLSATVVAPDCMTADAYATAFMVLGMVESERICRGHPELQAYFIYNDRLGNLYTRMTPGMQQLLQDEKARQAEEEAATEPEKQAGQ